MAYTVTTALGVFLLQTNVDSLKINYMDKGSGELVVLLHWMRREIRFITVPTMGKCCPAICIRIPVSGTLSAVFSHSST